MALLPKGKAAELALHFDNEQCGRGEGVLYYRVFSRGDRVNRAILSLVYCWLAGVPAALIPIIHLFTIPAFLIGGLVLFVQQLRAKTLIVRASGICPVHQHEVDIRLTPRQWPPTWVYCPQCNSSLHLVADVSVQEIEEAIE